MELIPHSLTPDLSPCSLRSLSGFGTRVRALVQLVLYSHKETIEASPKAISERTSYRLV